MVLNPVGNGLLRVALGVIPSRLETHGVLVENAAPVYPELYLLNDSRIVEGRTEAGGRDETAALEHF